MRKVVLKRMSMLGSLSPQHYTWFPSAPFSGPRVPALLQRAGACRQHAHSFFETAFSNSDLELATMNMLHQGGRARQAGPMCSQMSVRRILLAIISTSRSALPRRAGACRQHAHNLLARSCRQAPKLVQGSTRAPKTERHAITITLD